MSIFSKRILKLGGATGLAAALSACATMPEPEGPCASARTSAGQTYCANSIAAEQTQLQAAFRYGELENLQGSRAREFVAFALSGSPLVAPIQQRFDEEHGEGAFDTFVTELQADTGIQIRPEAEPELP